MTVGSQVKSCFSSIKSAEATLLSLAEKTKDERAKKVYQSTEAIINDIKRDLQRQIMFLTQEEPQYKQ